MKTTAALLAALLAVFALSLPVAAQDEAADVVAVVYVDEQVDRPIATALAELDRQYGNYTVAAPAGDLFDTDQRPAPVEADCVVTVGLNGDKVAEGVRYTTNGVGVVSAQGEDRHATATLAAEAVASCREWLAP